MAKRRTNAKKRKMVRRKKPVFCFTSHRQAEEAFHMERALREAEREQSSIELVRLGEKIKPPFFWKTNDGQTLRPSEMEESHLRNTISFLQRTLVRDFGTVTYLRRAVYRVEALFEMLKEAERRGLDV